MSTRRDCVFVEMVDLKELRSNPRKKKRGNKMIGRGEQEREKTMSEATRESEEDALQEHKSHQRKLN